jgi:adenylate cyclase, class 2
MTNSLLEQLGYHAKAYQENNRESYVLDNCEIEIDSRPMIPPYLEIESSNKENVLKMLEKLDLVNSITTSENTTDIYKRY